MGASWRVKDVIEAEEVIKTITPESAKEIFPENVERYQKKLNIIRYCVNIG